MHTVNAHCKMHTVKCTLWNAYCEMCTVKCVLWNAYREMGTVKCILWNANCEMHAVKCILWNTYREKESTNIIDCIFGKFTLFYTPWAAWKNIPREIPRDSFSWLLHCLPLFVPAAFPLFVPEMWLPFLLRRLSWMTTPTTRPSPHSGWRVEQPWLHVIRTAVYTYQY